MLEEGFREQPVLLAALKGLSDGLVLLLTGLIQKKSRSLKCSSAIDGEAVRDWLPEERGKTQKSIVFCEFLRFFTATSQTTA